MFDVIVESIVDILKTVPILLVVYTLLFLVETRLRFTPKLLERTQQLGPLFGAFAGAVPQCGFSAAAATLYNRGWLAPAALVAVFISTSDEAIPIMLAHPGAAKNVVLLILCKLVLAIVGGYALQWTLFRRDTYRPTEVAPDMDEGCDCHSGVLAGIFGRTIRTVLYLLLTMLLINLAVFFIGETRLAALLLSGSPLQPALCALIGLVPGCATSVLLSELFLSGSISFGAVIAGLSAGAGFGYTLLFAKSTGRKNAWRIIGSTYLVATLGGTILQLAMT